MKRRLILLVLAALLTSCGTTPADDPAMSVHFLDGPAGTIPTTVKTIVIDVYQAGMTTPDESQFTVANLMDADGDGRPDAVRSKLPTNEPIRIVVIGQDMAGAPAYVGQVGPITLTAGERRFVDLALYPVGTSQAITSSVYPGGMFPTATPLPDGRVLVAGGFGAPTPLASCPRGEPATTLCFVATAQRDAWVFSPADGLFRKIAGGMLVARGGQTATSLSDGRVLITGGASAITLVATPLGPDPTMPQGYSIDLRPRDATDAQTQLASFEIFDGAGDAAADPTRQGDPGSGTFFGAADDPAVPGRMNVGRMLAAASAVLRAQGDLVVVAGGRGGPDTFEVFDSHKAGGYGFYPTSAASTLHNLRAFPSAVTVGGATSPTIWIVGGASATGNTDLAEIWTPPSTTGGIGATTPATSTGFPSVDGMTAMDHPEYALFRPELGLVGTTMGSLLVAGWAGPTCEVGASMPTPVWFDPTMASPQEQCRQGVGPERSATVDLAHGATVDTSTGSPHAWGSSATLGDGKTFVLTGGLSSASLGLQSQIDIFSGDVAMGRAARATAHPSMARARAFHASARLPGRGVLTVGGVTVDATTLRFSLVPQAEALYLDASR